MRSEFWLALVLAVALVTGAVALAWLVPMSRARVRAEQASVARQEVLAGPAAARLQAPPEPTRLPPQRELPTQPTTERDSDEALITAALRDYARAGFARGWARVRTDELTVKEREELMAEFERALLAMPEAMGERAAEAQSEIEKRLRALDTSDAVDWLQRVEDSAPELGAVARDAERFAGFFRPRSAGGATHDGATLREQDPLEDGARLQFPAGVFRVADLARGRNPFPKDVTLAGAGMDATLLVMQDLGPRGALERFCIEDCTVFAENCSVADVRSGPTVLSLRRVRIVGFDCGAGGSYALDLRASAIQASLCHFEGGYGRDPLGLANLMRRTRPLVARFEGCTFERMSLDGAVQPGAVFARCAMIDMLQEPGAGPLYQDCSISVLPYESLHDEAVRRKDLNELFPGWQERIPR